MGCCCWSPPYVKLQSTAISLFIFCLIGKFVSEKQSLQVYVQQFRWVSRTFVSNWIDTLIAETATGDMSTIQQHPTHLQPKPAHGKMRNWISSSKLKLIYGKKLIISVMSSDQKMEQKTCISTIGIVKAFGWKSTITTTVRTLLAFVKEGTIGWMVCGEHFLLLSPLSLPGVARAKNCRNRLQCSIEFKPRL